MPGTIASEIKVAVTPPDEPHLVGRTVWVAGAVEALVGYTKDKWLGMARFTEVLSVESRPAAAAAIRGDGGRRPTFHGGRLRLPVTPLLSFPRARALLALGGHCAAVANYGQAAAARPSTAARQECPWTT
jgi:hypothetical protein